MLIVMSYDVGTQFVFNASAAIRMPVRLYKPGTRIVFVNKDIEAPMSVPVFSPAF